MVKIAKQKYFLFKNSKIFEKSKFSKKSKKKSKFLQNKKIVIIFVIKY